MTDHYIRPSVRIMALVGLTSFCVSASNTQSQIGVEVLASVEVGNVRNAGPLGALAAGAIVRYGRGEARVGTGRLGVFTGCESRYCDLRDASVVEVGGGVALPSASSQRAWTAGALIARVHERFDTPRPMLSGYIRRPWPLIGAVVGSTELRVHAVPIRGRGTRAGWTLRLGLGLGAREAE